MIKREEKDVGALMIDGDALDRAMVTAQIEAVRRHRLLGLPVAVWRDGRLVVLPPDQVALPGDSEESAE